MSENTTVLNKANFQHEVLESSQLTIVDFWAPWCAPCRMLTPILDEIATEMKGKVKVGKVNVDEEGMLSVEYGIMNIPAVFLFKNGEIVAKSIGLRSKPDLMEIINKNI